MLPTAAAKIATKPDPVDVLAARAQARAHLWCEGEFPDLHSALDPLQAAAERTGVIDRIGMDATQAILSRAFRAVRPPCDVVPARDVVPDPIPEREPGPRAAPSTVDALFYSLRQRGSSALAERDCLDRLAELSTAQIRDVIGRLIAVRGRFRAIDDDLLLLLGEQL